MVATILVLLYGIIELENQVLTSTQAYGFQGIGTQHQRYALDRCKQLIRVDAVVIILDEEKIVDVFQFRNQEPSCGFVGEEEIACLVFRRKAILGEGQCLAVLRLHDLIIRITNKRNAKLLVQEMTQPVVTMLADDAEEKEIVFVAIDYFQDFTRHVYAKIGGNYHGRTAWMERSSTQIS